MRNVGGLDVGGTSEKVIRYRIHFMVTLTGFVGREAKDDLFEQLDKSSCYLMRCGRL